jgi:hydroxyacylglutathione hydrolase
MQVKLFTFNPFFENAYILYDDTNECVIIDPGCYTKEEKESLVDFITAKGLTPVRLLNTHAHVDHIFGNAYVNYKYKLLPELHKLEEDGLRAADVYSNSYGVNPPRSPMPEQYIDEDTAIKFGNTELKVLFTPGHSVGHVVFYDEAEGRLFGGDVLFRDGIGRADLPGGSFRTLINSIKEKLFTLPDSVTVFPGHGPPTTIGYEKENNPFLNAEYAN